MARWRDYLRPRNEWRYFEIDALIAWLAIDSGFFQMMSRNDPNAEIVLGDARLTLAREPDGHFGLLKMEAFSTDAIPTHLLTREAVAMYMQKLARDGLLLLHISNRFLDLEPVVAGVLADLDLTALTGVSGAGGKRRRPHRVSIPMGRCRSRQHLARQPRPWRTLAARETVRPAACVAVTIQALVGVIHWSGQTGQPAGECPAQAPSE